MSFSAAAIYAQPMVQRVPDPGGDCAPYPRPDPLVVITDLTAAITWQESTTVETNLCSEIE